MSVSRHALIVVITNAVKILCGLVILKVAAIYLSVEDFGRFGQFMALTAIVNMLAGGGVGNGVVKLLAEHKELISRHNIISSAGVFWLFSCVLIAAFLWLTKAWHESYLGSASYIIIYLALAQVFWGQSNFFTNYMVSRQDTKSIMICGLKANGIGLAFFLVIFYYHQTLYSAMIGFLLFSSIPFLMNAHRVLPNNKEMVFFYKPIFSLFFMKKLSHYSLVLIVGAIAIPVTQVYLRDYVGEVLGWLSVGYWQAVLRISDAHMQFFGVVNLSVLLPYLSKLNKENTLNLSNKKMLNVFTAILILLILSSLTLIILKDWVILVLFSSEFASISSFVILQTIGDFLKVLLSLVVVICLAKGYWQIALYSELLQAIILYTITIILLPQYGMNALMYAYMMSSSVSLFVIGFLLWRQK